MHSMQESSSQTRTSAVRATRALPALLAIYILGTLCLQAFNLVFQKVGDDVGAPSQASLITAIPGVILGIACFIYGSLGDFASLRRMTMFGIATLCLGSLGGFLLHGTIIWVIVFRIIQTIGFQTACSVYLVIVARYLTNTKKLLYFGLFTAAYQLATAIGVLCGGWFSAVDWSYLFLIPALSLLFVPVLVKNLPGASGSATHIDIPGFAIFGTGVLLLTLFFSTLQWWMLAAALAMFTLFAVYIAKARAPFITPDFFRNTRWLESVLLIVIFYFINFSITPLCNDFGTSAFHLTSSQVSLMLLPALLLATVSGTCSAFVVNRLGKHMTIVTGGTMMALGLLTSAFLVKCGPAAIAVTMACVYSGMAMLYSPTVDTVLGTLKPEQTGRGVGMNDLAMQGSGAIGIAVFGGPIADQPFASNTILADQGAAANAATLFLIYAAIVIFGVVWMQLHYQHVYNITSK